MVTLTGAIIEEKWAQSVVGSGKWEVGRAVRMPAVRNCWDINRWWEEVKWETLIGLARNFH